MKRKLHNLIFGKNIKLTLLVLLAVFAWVGLGCRGSKAEVKPIPAAFLGDWEGQDGSTLSLRADNSGDYRSGSNKVEGGTAEVDEAARTVSVTFFGIGKTLKIDQPPSGDQMKLDGVNYRRRGGFGQTNEETSRPPVALENSSNTSSASDDEAPSTDEYQELARTSLLDFNDAVQQGDFTDFHANIAKLWQRQTSPAQLEQLFAEFINKKVNIGSIRSMNAEFSPRPTVKYDSILGIDVLGLTGRYRTSPRNTKFELKYAKEAGDWKLIGIRVDTTS